MRYRKKEAPAVAQHPEARTKGRVPNGRGDCTVGPVVVRTLLPTSSLREWDRRTTDSDGALSVADRERGVGYAIREYSLA
jgi:hypothetical protein